MPSSENKIYTAADIERYHSGQMPASEMHALEKAALDDPFLADALEGFQFASTPAADLDAIRQKLFGEKEEEKKTVIVRKFQWLKIAAAVLLLAMGGWFTMNLLEQDDQTIALEQAEQRPKPESTPARITDSLSNTAAKDVEVAETEPAVSENRPPQVKQEPETTSTKSAKSTLVSRKSARKKMAESPEPVIMLSAPAFSDQKEVDREAAVARVRNTEEIQVNQNVTNNNLPLNQIPIEQLERMNRTMPSIENNRTETVYDGYIRSRTQKQMARNNETFIAAAPARVDSVRNLTIIMKRDSLPPVDVVILGNDSTKPAQRPYVVIETLEPAEGWARYDDYVAGNLVPPDEFKTKTVNRGEVQLSFEVNTKGEPVNIAVVKSLCAACDKEAIRLLKEGPKWKREQGKKGLITIKF